MTVFESIDAQPSLFGKDKFVNEQGDTLLYRILFPDFNPARRYPLVIFLHGMGERGHDNEKQLTWGVMNFATDKNRSEHPAIVVAPQCPDDQWWSNFSEDRMTGTIVLNEKPSAVMERVVGMIKSLIRTLPVDTSRLYITGLSMGGYGTFDLISRYPKLFAAAVPVCGGGDVGQARYFAEVPIWIFHGADDTAVPPKYALEMTTALRKAGGAPGCTIYPGVGHFSWIQAYSDPLMMSWLFDQRKK